MTVSQPVISVSISPQVASTTTGGALTFTATVSGTSGSQSNAVQWSVQESGGGSVDSGGHYTAPGTTGTFHVVATSVADPFKSAAATVTVGSSSGLLPPDRLTVWNLGVAGGIPNRTTVCATVNASTYGNGSSDATAGIQAAVNGCLVRQVVQLSAGVFTINGGNIIQIGKGITLRGAGPGQTTLQKTDGAKPGQEATGPNPSPIVLIGPARWDNNNERSTNLTADAAKGAYSINVSNAAGFSTGQIALLDELSGAGGQRIWPAAGRFLGRVGLPGRLAAAQPRPGNRRPFPDAASWFSRPDRPTNEFKQIDHVSGNTIFFNTPVHISFRISQIAQLTAFSYSHTQNAGVENLKVIGGDQGNIRFQWAANCWARSIENTVWHDEGFALERSFRVDIRESYIHDAAWAQPGGAGYDISFSDGTSEVLVRPPSSSRPTRSWWRARRAPDRSSVTTTLMTVTSTPTPTGFEVGLKASTWLSARHHVLFEGNLRFQLGLRQDDGNAIYHTIFRNHLRGIRRDFGDASGSNGPQPLRQPRLLVLAQLCRQRARRRRPDGWMGLRERQHGYAGHFPARLGLLAALPRRLPGRGAHSPFVTETSMMSRIR